MCCDETPSSEPRVGARVAIVSRSQGNLGNLLFLNPSAPGSSVATHVTFNPGEGVVMNDNVLVSIQ